MFCRLKNQTRSQCPLPLWPKLYEPNELHIYFWKLNTMSGWAHWASNPQKCEPSRPQPVCTSSAFLRACIFINRGCKPAMHNPPRLRINYNQAIFINKSFVLFSFSRVSFSRKQCDINCFPNCYPNKNWYKNELYNYHCKLIY